MMEESLANQLGLKGEVEELCLRWTDETTRTEKRCRNVQLGISKIRSNKQTIITKVQTVNVLGLPIQSLDATSLAAEFFHLRGLPVESYNRAVPQILVGLQHWALCVPLETIEGALGDPIATRCRLGWTISGKFSHDPSGVVPHFHVCECHDRRLHDQIREHNRLRQIANCVEKGYVRKLTKEEAPNTIKGQIFSRTIKGSDLLTALLCQRFFTVSGSTWWQLAGIFVKCFIKFESPRWINHHNGSCG